MSLLGSLQWQPHPVFGSGPRLSWRWCLCFIHFLTCVGHKSCCFYPLIISLKILSWKHYYYKLGPFNTLLMQFPTPILLKQWFSTLTWNHLGRCLKMLMPKSLPAAGLRSTHANLRSLNLKCWPSYFPLIKPPVYPGILFSSLHGWKGEKCIRNILI